MKNDDFDKTKNVFFNNIEPRFDAFKKKMRKLSLKNEIEFDEDIFMDTIIKSMTTFSNQNATDNDVDNYFWVAYKQNVFSKFSRNKFRNTINFDNLEDNIFCEEYNSDIDEIVDLIKNEVKNKFGDVVYEAWILHVCEDYTYLELEKCGYKGLNLHNEFRQIKRYITQKFINKNNNLKRLLIENDFLK